VRLLVLLAALFVAPTADGSHIEGKVTVHGPRDHRDVVVYIDRISGKRFLPPAAPVMLDQKNLTFVPHVLPVLIGTKVAFPNSDEIRHNVFSPTSTAKFNLGTYPRNTTMHYVFDKPGVVTLLCNVHTEMSAFVVVTETPYFAVTDKDGRFVIRDVPPGKYLLKFWHERTKAGVMMIEVHHDQPLNVTMELKK